MNHLVIGAGEVGRAVAEVLGSVHPVWLRDIDPGLSAPPPDVLHICFPYGASFVADAWRYQAQYEPEITVIHSTVPVGTSSALDAVHSPVTGRHPHLAESIRTFVKMFGGPRSPEAATWFAACGVTTECYPDAATTEAGKLLATLQYGWTIAVQKEAYAFCRSVGVDPEVAYRRFNEVYNAGYEALGEPYRLPILCDVPGPIGGHCVIPNARLTASPLAEMLLSLNDGWG